METTQQQPVIPEYINAASEPPFGFIPFGPPTGHGGSSNGNGNVNGYPRSPIYAGMPLTTSSTPRQIYAVSPTATPPTFLPPMPFAGASPGMGMGAPVIPSPPRDRRVVPGSGTPHHRSVPLGGGGGGSSGSATPASRTWDLPGSYSQGGGPGVGGMLRRVPSNGSMSSHGGSYPTFGSATYVEPPFYPPEEDEEDEEDNYQDEATRRNTHANANVGAGVLPIPPPSFSKRGR
jgi:hypothetical protein